jgi:hypothetical protein
MVLFEIRNGTWSVRPEKMDDTGFNVSPEQTENPLLLRVAEDPRDSDPFSQSSP